MTAPARLALRATGLLRELNEAGVLTAADVHVATRLGVLWGETDERVLLAAALAVRGTRGGSVVLRLDEVPGTVLPDDLADEEPAAGPLPWPEPAGWQAAVAGSPLVTDAGGPAGRPLRRSGDGLWLERYWRLEEQVAAALIARAADPPPVDGPALAAALARLWPGDAPDDQRQAAAVCLLSRVAVLGGGPGTGKTTTVARLLLALREVSPRPPRVALAAPTGKAAARLQEAVRGAADPAWGPAPTDEERAWLAGLTASTLHRLLRLRRGGEQGRPVVLPHDLVVVDEASMLALPLVARLLAALRPGARLLLVGDPDQLASVEAGAVLADLVAPARDGGRTERVAQRLAEVAPHDPAPPLLADTPTAAVRGGVALLRSGHRFGGAVAELADAVRRGDGDGALAVLTRGDPAVRFLPLEDDAAPAGPVRDALREQVLGPLRAVVAAARAGDAAGALDALAGHRLLCAHRRGPRGVAHWEGQVTAWVVEELGVAPRPDGRWVGLPLLVTANDPDTGLSNGDTGVCLERDGMLVAVFDLGAGVVAVPLSRLADVRPLHALTVHRSQGSQFSRVTVLLPPATSPLGNRGTLYTAVTRAQEAVLVLGSAEAVRAAVDRPVLRATGLRQRLA